MAKKPKTTKKTGGVKATPMTKRVAPAPPGANPPKTNSLLDCF